MKTFQFVTKIALLSVLATLIPLALAAQAGDASLSKDDLHKLIASATSAADHQKLADYYKNQAQLAEASAAEHEDMLKAYAENPSPHKATKWPNPEGYCRDMVRIYKQQAQLNTDLAAHHERMAKDAPQNKTSAGKEGLRLRSRRQVCSVVLWSACPTTCGCSAPVDPKRNCGIGIVGVYFV